MYSKNVIVFLATILASLFAWGQSEISIQQIMQGETFVGALPSNVYWSPDSRELYFSRNPDQEALPPIYRTDNKGSNPVRLDTEERKALVPRTYSFNANRTLCTYSKNGDVFLLDIRTGTQLQITYTVEDERNPTFSLDELSIFYQKGHDLYAWSIDEGTTQQLTQFLLKDKPKEDKKGTDQAEWLKADQLAYFHIVRERDSLREIREKMREALKPDRPLEIYVGDNKSLSQVQISPDGRFVSYRLTSSPRNPGNTHVPDFVTATGYIRDLRARPKVGSPSASYETWIYDRTQDTTYQIKTQSLPGILRKPAFMEAYHKGDSAWVDTFSQPRKVLVHAPVYTQDARKAAVVIRSLDNKDRWIMELLLESGALKLIDHQRDEAWIGGPGIEGWNFARGNIGWLGDNKTLWFQSEESGYSHLYTVDVQVGTRKALTSGNFEIQELILSQDKSTFYLITNEKHPGEKHLYRMAVEGGERELMTEMTGAHDVFFAPDEKHIAFRHSFSNKPWELYVMPNKAQGRVRQVTESTTEAFNAYSWRVPENITFSASDGAEVHARLYRPEEPETQGPAVIFVHGAGYLQNAHKWWSSYYREYMFHNFLVDQGYTVLDIDYRGSAGYGRDWRTGIYRFMGGKDLSDQVDGANLLADQYEVDPGRIGIYGGSYGGFITLMALFTTPEVFGCGAALRSVTDWAHYNDPYTSNILNTPVEDSMAYKKSSPIYHAEGLQNPLLMLHGMVDTNVQFQDVVRLSQRLIELKKENWELAVFPMEGHGFREASSWADEYKRIFKLFETHLK